MEKFGSTFLENPKPMSESLEEVYKKIIRTKMEVLSAMIPRVVEQLRRQIIEKEFGKQNKGKRISAGSEKILRLGKSLESVFEVRAVQKHPDYESILDAENLDEGIIDILADYYNLKNTNGKDNKRKQNKTIIFQNLERMVSQAYQAGIGSKELTAIEAILEFIKRKKA